MMDESNDMLLLNSLKQGNLDAYGILFKKYYKLLATQAFYILKDEMEAEDIVQLLFIEIWDRQLYLNINTSIKAYLQSAVYNRCLNAISKHNTAQKKLDQYQLFLNYKGSEAEVDHYHAEKVINEILREMPEQRSRAFNLVYLEDKKYKEAADEMGITINSVKTHLKLAMKSLRLKFVTKNNSPD
jgi:RNA polymerase sigma-70 factor (ECF subfamily)